MDRTTLASLRPASGADQIRRNGSPKAESGKEGDKFKHNFEFVDGRSGRWKGRQHVTREYYRKKTWKKQNDTGHDDSGQKSPSPPKKMIVQVMDWDTPSSSSSKRSMARGSRNSNRSPTDSNDLHMRQGSIGMLLGEGRIDPFASYPIQATQEVHQLVDHFVVVIPSLLMKHWSRTVKRTTSTIQLFNLYRQHPASFFAMLHHSNHHRSSMYGIPGETPQGIKYKLDTLAAVRGQMSSLGNQPPSDGLIVATGLLANAERIWGSTDASRIHWRAARDMIASRGGFHGLGNNVVLHTKLMYSFIALSGATDDNESPYLDPYTDSVALGSTFAKFTPREAISLGCDELIGILQRAKALSLKSLAGDAREARSRRQFPSRMSIFRPGSRLYELLMPQNSGYPADKSRALENCRFACLAYITASLVEYENLSPVAEEFCKTLLQRLVDDGDEMSLTAEHLLWIFIQGIEGRDTCDRTWVMSRIVGISKRLTRERWDQLDSAFRTFLRVPETGEDVATMSKAIESPDQFRAEALRERIENAIGKA